jgi:hypothetical protein
MYGEHMLATYLYGIHTVFAMLCMKTCTALSATISSLVHLVGRSLFVFSRRKQSKTQAGRKKKRLQGELLERQAKR